MLICFDSVIIGTEAWLNYPLVLCVANLLCISVYFYFSKLLLINDFSCDNINMEKIAIIIAFVTVDYSIIQLCDPPIGVFQVLLLFILVILVLMYAIWTRKTLKDICVTCVLSTFISVLFVMPIMYTSYYEDRIFDIREEIQAYEQTCDNYGIPISERKPYEEKFDPLFNDEYFVKHYKDSLYKEIYNYIDYRYQRTFLYEEGSNSYILKGVKIETPSTDKENRYSFVIEYPEKNKVYVWNNSIRFKMSIVYFENQAKVLNDDELNCIKKCIESGIIGYSADVTVENSFEKKGQVIKVIVSLDNIHGVSGNKTLVIPEGIFYDSSRNPTQELTIKAFQYYGWDYLTVFFFFFVMIAIATYRIIQLVITKQKKQ